MITFIMWSLTSIWDFSWHLLKAQLPLYRYPQNSNGPKFTNFSVFSVLNFVENLSTCLCGTYDGIIAYFSGIESASRKRQANATDFRKLSKTDNHQGETASYHNEDTNRWLWESASSECMWWKGKILRHILGNAILIRKILDPWCWPTFFLTGAWIAK